MSKLNDIIIYVTLSAIMAVGLTYGADKKGSELPSATSVTSSDKAIIIQDGTTKTVTYGNVPHNVLGSRTAADAHSQGAITGLTSALAAKQNVMLNATSLTKIGTGSDGSPSWNGEAWPGGTGSGHSIQDEGIDVTQRDTINFTGAGVTVTDVAGKTTVTIPSGGGVSSFNSRTGAVTPQSGDYTKSDVGLGNVDNTSDANKPVSSATQTALDLKVDENVAITGATKTKITYDAKGLVTGGADATTADIADSTDKRYVTDAQKTVLGNTSGTNTGDQDLSGLVPTSRTVNSKALTSNISLTASDVGAQATSEKGQANGYASLGAGGLVPDAQLGSGGSLGDCLKKGGTYETCINVADIPLATDTTDGLMSSANYTAIAAIGGAAVTSTYSVNEGAIGDGFLHPLTDSSAGMRWTFDSTVEGWTASWHSTVSYSNGKLVIAGTDTSPAMQSNLFPGLYGAKHSIIKIKIKRTAGTGWLGAVLYKTDTRDTSWSYTKSFADPTNGTIGGEGEAVIDMSSLTNGGTDYINSNIKQLTIHLGANASDTFEVDYITAFDTTTKSSYTVAEANTKWPYLTSDNKIKSASNSYTITEGNISQYSVDWCALQNGLNKAGEQTGQFILSKGNHVIERTVRVNHSFVTFTGLGSESSMDINYSGTKGKASNIVAANSFPKYMPLVQTASTTTSITIKNIGYIQENGTNTVKGIMIGDDWVFPTIDLNIGNPGTLTVVNDTTLSLSNDFSDIGYGSEVFPVIRFKWTDSSGEIKWCNRGIASKTGTGPYSVTLKVPMNGVSQGSQNPSYCGTPTNGTSYQIMHSNKMQSEYGLGSYGNVSRNIVIDSNSFYGLHMAIENKNGITFNINRNFVSETDNGILILTPTPAAHEDNFLRLITNNTMNNGGNGNADIRGGAGIRTVAGGSYNINNNVVQGFNVGIWINNFEAGDNMNSQSPIWDGIHKYGFNTISNNNIQYAWYPIRVELTYITSIIGNTFWNYNMTGTGEKGGISILNSSRVTVIGNQLASVNGPGVYVINDKQQSIWPKIMDSHTVEAARTFMNLNGTTTTYVPCSGMVVSDNVVYRHDGYVGTGGASGTAKTDPANAAVRVLTNNISGMETGMNVTNNNAFLDGATGGSPVVCLSTHSDNVNYYPLPLVYPGPTTATAAGTEGSIQVNASNVLGQVSGLKYESGFLKAPGGLALGESPLTSFGINHRKTAGASGVFLQTEGNNLNYGGVLVGAHSHLASTDIGAGWCYVDSGAFSLNGHGMSNDQSIVFTTVDPSWSNVTVGTTYYLRFVDANTFYIAATVGGDIIKPNGNASGNWAYQKKVLPPSGARLAGLAGWGYDGSVARSAASITLKSEGGWVSDQASSGNQRFPSAITFETAGASDIAKKERFRISSNGYMSNGGFTAPRYNLDFYGSASFEAFNAGSATNTNIGITIKRGINPATNGGSVSKGFGVASRYYIVDNIKTFDPATAINTTTDIITLTAHGFTDKQPVIMKLSDSTSAGVYPTISGANNTNNFYISLIDANSFKIQYSSGVIADFTATGSGLITIQTDYELGDTAFIRGDTDEDGEFSVAVGYASTDVGLVKKEILRAQTNGDFIVGGPGRDPATPVWAVGMTKVTSYGGTATLYTNKFASPLAHGEIVQADASNDDAVTQASADSYGPIGVVYGDTAGNATCAADALCWIVSDRRADILMKDSTACTRGYYVHVSDTAGRGACSNDPSLVTHNREIGHALTGTAGGTNVTIRGHLHFN